MYATYHLASAQEANTNIMDSIKTAFKSKPITIIVEETEKHFDITTDIKSVLDERLQENEINYLSADESINQLNKKYGL
jgi:hypothetical protein